MIGVLRAHPPHFWPVQRWVGVASERNPQRGPSPHLPAHRLRQPTGTKTTSTAPFRSLSAPLITFLVALLVVGWGAWRPVFGVDEYLTQSAVERSWADLFVWMSTTDPAPAPYYVLIKLWSYVSTDLFWLRIPSILAMAGALTVVTGLVRRLAGTAIGGLTFLVLLSLPIISRFGQENRPYAFALLATVLAVACWIRIVVRPGSRRSMVWFGLAVAGMGLAHLYTLTMIGALAVACLLRPPGERARAVRRTVGPAVVALVAISPHIAANLRHPTGSPTDGPLTSGSLTALLVRMLPIPVAVGLLVLVGLGVAYAVRTPRVRQAAVLALCWSFVPTLTLLVAKVTVDLPATKARYFVFVMPAVALLAALGLRQLAVWWRPLALVALTVLVVAGLPRQVEIRAVDGHNRDSALSSMLRVAADRQIPIVAANRQAIRLVHAATYPHVRLSRSVDPGTTHYAMVVERVRYAAAVPDRFVFYRQPGPWRQVLRCSVAQSVVLVFESREAALRDGDPGPEELGAQLSDATSGLVSCDRVDELTR